ncbi:MAG: hypothetical protein Q4E36_04210 [Bacillota bacterium]|nr:hypothetical protein [Bacillota bacterium]
MVATYGLGKTLDDGRVVWGKQVFTKKDICIENEEGMFPVDLWTFKIRFSDQISGFDIYADDQLVAEKGTGRAVRNPYLISRTNIHVVADGRLMDLEDFLEKYGKIIEIKGVYGVRNHIIK